MQYHIMCMPKQKSCIHTMHFWTPCQAFCILPDHGTEQTGIPPLGAAPGNHCRADRHRGLSARDQARRNRIGTGVRRLAHADTRGAMVAATDPQRLVEMFEVMAELEAMCAGLAARRITEAEQKALLEAHHACEAARDSNDPDA